MPRVCEGAFVAGVRYAISRARRMAPYIRRGTGFPIDVHTALMQRRHRPCAGRTAKAGIRGQAAAPANSRAGKRQKANSEPRPRGRRDARTDLCGGMERFSTNMRGQHAVDNRGARHGEERACRAADARADSTAAIDQKAGSPTLVPTIRGEITLLSSCWSAMTNTVNHSALTGSMTTSSRRQGTVPMSGPKNGIRLLTPTIMEKRRVGESQRAAAR